MSALTLDDGRPLALGEVLAKAGEGTILEVLGRKDLAAKVFHTTLKDLPTKLDKVAAMIAGPPTGAMQADGFVVLTWPQQLISDAGRPIGYVMPRIDTATAVEIHSMSNPYNRSHPLPGAPRWTTAATWAHLVSVAANLCLAVEVVHRVDAVIGDFQERNILVADTTQVTLVDCDSMQIADAAGRQFLCGVGRPEFTAPELADLDLRAQSRRKQSDLFALAVHIYQLLMGGNHPFMRGVWTGAGEQPGALSLAKHGFFAGGPGSPLASHPLAPPLSFLPAEVGGLFVRAFTDGASDPGLRPTADQWRQALSQMSTTDCGPSGHRIPAGTRDCPWCAIDAERTRRKRSVPVRNRVPPAGWSDDLINAPVRLPTGLVAPSPRKVTAPAPSVWSPGYQAGSPVGGQNLMGTVVRWPVGLSGSVPAPNGPRLIGSPQMPTKSARVTALAIFLTTVAILVVVGLVMIISALVQLNASSDEGRVIEIADRHQFARSTAEVRSGPTVSNFSADWPIRSADSANCGAHLATDAVRASVPAQAHAPSGPVHRLCFPDEGTIFKRK